MLRPGRRSRSSFTCILSPFTAVWANSLVGYEERGYPNSRARPPRSGDCDNAWTSSLRKGGTEGDNQVAAPTGSSTPNLHRATIAQQECGWKGGDRGGSAQPEKTSIREEKEKTTEKEKPT